MKIGLFHKILGTIILILFLMATVLVVIVQLVVHQSFSKYVTSIELGELDDLAKALEAQYKGDGSWVRLRGDLRLWQRFIESYLPEARARRGTVKDLTPRDIEYARQAQRRPWPPPDHPSWALPDRPPHRPVRIPGLDAEPPDSVQGGREWHRDLPPPPPPRPGNLLIGPRLTLFDSNRKPVVGHGVSSVGHRLRPLLVDGKTVGWLGLVPVDHISHPLNADFLRQQARAFYIASLAVFLAAVAVAFLLSRHLLAPIRKLALATKDLASFRFDTRIDVQTKDELGQLASDFNAMTAKLKKYEHMREQWISDISHELRTPLAILKGEIEALQDGIRQVTPARLGSLHSEVTRMGKLVEDLHLLSRADSQNLMQRKQPVQIVQTLRNALFAFAHRLQQAGIELQVAVPEDDEITVAGDEDRLAQLFSNLIENTVRYTDWPGILRVSLYRLRDELTIVFEDTAPGVPEDALGRLFDRLYRVDKSRSRGLGGSGLGLSICKGIVDGHDGQIRADNAPLGGIRVTINFPVFQE